MTGIPLSLEEELHMLLDVRFDPQRLRFLEDLAWKAYPRKCDILKKSLNITVAVPHMRSWQSISRALLSPMKSTWVSPTTSLMKPEGFPILCWTE
jgi:hypothetical protein